MSKTLATGIMIVSVTLGVVICRLAIHAADLLPADAPPVVHTFVWTATMLLGFFFILPGVLNFYVTLFRKKN
jgi:hypothetical protein